MVFMDYRWYLESQMSTTYIDALGRPKMILANYDMFRFGIGWSVQPRSMFLESFNQGRYSMFNAFNASEFHQKYHNDKIKFRRLVQLFYSSMFYKILILYP